MWVEIGQLGYSIGAVLAVAFALAVVIPHEKDD